MTAAAASVATSPRMARSPRSAVVSDDSGLSDAPRASSFVMNSGSAAFAASIRA
jgi:hypothetical protein